MNADGLKNLIDSVQNCRCMKNIALKSKTLTWRKRGNLLDRYVHNINDVNEKINKSKEEKTSITVGKLDGGSAESNGETRRQRLHLQHRSGKNSQCRRVGAHDIPHHLINGGDFGFLEGIPYNRRGECRQDTHSQGTSVQYSLITARTLQCAWLKTKRDLQASLCTKISVVIWCVTCLIHVYSLTRFLP